MPSSRQQRTIQLNDELEEEISSRLKEPFNTAPKMIREAVKIYLDMSEENWDKLRKKAKTDKVTVGNILTSMVAKLKE